MLPANYTVPACTSSAFTRWRIPRPRLRTSNCSLPLIYLPRKDGRPSQPGWLTCRHNQTRRAHVIWNVRSATTTQMQIVKEQGHVGPNVYLEAWQRHHFGPRWVELLFKLSIVLYVMCRLILCLSLYLAQTYTPAIFALSIECTHTRAVRDSFLLMFNLPK